MSDDRGIELSLTDAELRDIAAALDHRLRALTDASWKRGMANVNVVVDRVTDLQARIDIARKTLAKMPGKDVEQDRAAAYELVESECRAIRGFDALVIAPANCTAMAFDEGECVIGPGASLLDAVNALRAQVEASDA